MGASGREAAAIEEIQKRYGRVLKGPQEVTGIPTGSPGLDRNSGVGGWPRGRISEVWGGPSSGKTMLLTTSMIECLRIGGRPSFLDLERTFNWEWAEKQGLDVGSVNIIRPDSAEAAFSSARILLSSGAVDLLVVDSVAGLVPESVIAGTAELEEATLSQLLSRELVPLKGVIENSKAAVVFINQERCRLKKVQPQGVDRPEWEAVPMGGNALGFYASLRCSIQVQRRHMRGDTCLGTDNTILVEKNKLGRARLISRFRDRAGVGIDREWELATLAKSLDVFTVRDECVWFDGKRVAGSMPEVRDKLAEDIELRDAVYKAVLSVPLADAGSID